MGGDYIYIANMWHSGNIVKRLLFYNRDTDRVEYHTIKWVPNHTASLSCLGIGRSNPIYELSLFKKIRQPVNIKTIYDGTNDTKIKFPMKRKFKLGLIYFKPSKINGNHIPIFALDQFPEGLIRHGSMIINRANIHYKAEIIAYYGEYYIVKYIDENNDIVQLGFEENVLRK